jgi:hypothetical protein
MRRPSVCHVGSARCDELENAGSSGGAELMATNPGFIEHVLEQAGLEGRQVETAASLPDPEPEKP